MYYTITGHELLLFHSPNKSDVRIDLKPFEAIEEICVHSRSGLVAMKAVPKGKRIIERAGMDHFVTYRGDFEFFLFDPQQDTCRNIYPHSISNISWFPQSNRLAFQSEQHLCTIYADGTGFTNHVKIGEEERIGDLLVNPDETKISYWYIQGSDLRIHLYRFGQKRKTPENLSIIMHRYSWLDADTIVHALRGGIRTSNFATGQSQILIRKVAQLQNKLRLDMIWPKLERILESMEEYKSEEIQDPECDGDRLLFRIRVSAKDESTLFAVLRTDSDLSEVHLEVLSHTKISYLSTGGIGYVLRQKEPFLFIHPQVVQLDPEFRLLPYRQTHKFVYINPAYQLPENMPQVFHWTLSLDYREAQRAITHKTIIRYFRSSLHFDLADLPVRNLSVDTSAELSQQLYEWLRDSGWAIPYTKPLTTESTMNYLYTASIHIYSEGRTKYCSFTADRIEDLGLFNEIFGIVLSHLKELGYLLPVMTHLPNIVTSRQAAKKWLSWFSR